MNALLSIQTALYGTATILASAYHTPPFKLANITENKKSPDLQLMIMSSSPGILCGDDYSLKINVADHTSLRLFTQSYQRLFKAKKPSSQNLKVTVGKGAKLCYIPHPTVPHQQANFKSVSSISLQPTSILIWGEITTCGRKLKEEAFQFTKLHLVTDIRIENKLVVRENILIEPLETDLYAMGQWEGYTHQATLTIIHPGININQYMDAICQIFEKETGLIYGVSNPFPDGFITRVLGFKGEQMYKCLGEIARLFDCISLKNQTYDG